MASHILSSLRFAALAALFSGVGVAQTLIVDRGLPTANLNAPDASRSNVALRSANTPTGGFDAFVVGDRFNVGNPFGGQPIKISQISLWVIKSAEATFADFDFASASSYELLLTDPAAGLLLASDFLNPATPTSVNYANGQDYLTSGGTQVDLLRLDFYFDLVVNPGTTLFFGVAGFDKSGNFLAPAVHASNAGLSGSPQQGSDGEIYLFGSAAPHVIFQGLAAFSSNGLGFDKSSDLNIQVFASAVPEPSTYGLMAAGALVGLVTLRRRMKRAA